MTNPDNIVRVRARNGGRASVYEANGWCQAYGSGILEGTGVVQNTVANMTVLVGGSSSKPDVLIAQNPAGYKIALDLVGQQPVTITTPASNSRISAIVAYTDDLALESTEDTVTGSPASCGLIVVNGNTSASPSAPTDTQIRSAITSDGATGSQASYAIIATIRVASNTTSITDALITRNQAGVQSSKIDFTTIIPQANNVEIDTGIKFGDKTVYAQKFAGTVSLVANKRVEVVLATVSSTPLVISTIGWTRPGATSTATSPVATSIYGVDGSMTGYFATLGHPQNNTLRLRWMYGQTATGAYDIVIYYTKN